MKVHYNKTISEKFRDIIVEACDKKKIIDYIEINKIEAKEIFYLGKNTGNFSDPKYNNYDKFIESLKDKENMMQFYGISVLLRE